MGAYLGDCVITELILAMPEPARTSALARIKLGLRTASAATPARVRRGRP